MTTTTVTLDLNLYAWQREAFDAWHDNGGWGVVEAVTGTGKTRLAIAAIREACVDGQRCVVLVPSVALQDQWVRAIGDQLPDLRVGRWGNSHSDRLRDCDVIVAVINSAIKHVPEMREAGLVVADECHNYGAKKHRRALVHVPRRLGLTATLQRSDEGVDRVLLPYFGRVVYRVGYDRALADGIVSPFTVDLVPVDFADRRSRVAYEQLTHEMKEVREVLIGKYGYPHSPGRFLERVMAGDPDWQSRSARLAAEYKRAFVARRELLASETAKIGALARLAPDIQASGRCLVFTQVTSAAIECAQALKKAGVRAAAIHSGLTARQRKHLVQDFEAGHLQALVAPQVLDEGVDLPDTDLGIIVAASRSKRQMIQRLGRILRPKSDGRAARFVILSMNGTSEDPAGGAHEAFLDEVLPYAETVSRQ